MEQTKQKNTVWQSALVGIKLLLICAIVAGVVSFVYALTADTYEKNLQKTKNEAIGSIFGQTGLVCEVISEDGADATVYRVLEGDVHIGYCVEVTSSGYGGDMGLMVGFDRTNAVLGISVVSHSETPGLGSRATEKGFLDQFIGKRGTVTLREDVDAISGATISSTAVTNGVNLAAEALANVQGISLATKVGGAQ